MTSPVSAIEKAMEGVTHPDAPAWIAVAQDGRGHYGGFWTCAAATDESPRYIRADIYAALARQAEALQRENAELRKKLDACDWYWPEDDTSSEACADGPWQIAENHDTGPGEVFGYSRGGVIETRYFGYLEAAEDADSDDNFEVDEPTQEAAEAKIAAEMTRRAAIAANGTAEKS